MPLENWRIVLDVLLSVFAVGLSCIFGNSLAMGLLPWSIGDDDNLSFGYLRKHSNFSTGRALNFAARYAQTVM